MLNPVSQKLWVAFDRKYFEKDKDIPETKMMKLKGTSNSF